MLGIRCVVTSARDAMNQEVVDLPVLGMEQNGVTARTGIINCIRTCDQNGRGAYDRTAYRSPNRPQTDFQILRMLRAQDTSSLQAGVRLSLSHRRVAQGRIGDADMLQGSVVSCLSKTAHFFIMLTANSSRLPEAKTVQFCRSCLSFQRSGIVRFCTKRPSADR